MLHLHLEHLHKIFVVIDYFLIIDQQEGVRIEVIQRLLLFFEPTFVLLEKLQVQIGHSGLFCGSL